MMDGDSEDKIHGTADRTKLLTVYLANGDLSSSTLDLLFGCRLFADLDANGRATFGRDD